MKLPDWIGFILNLSVNTFCFWAWYRMGKADGVKKGRSQGWMDERYKQYLKTGEVNLSDPTPKGGDR